ncbi:MAG: hypothetical protein FJ276_07885 [Planctomycetes bacterium]|nr:hypothetical protein [Planctomycetota bacterium]
MRIRRFWLPCVLALLLLAGAARGELRRGSGLIAEKTEWENPYYVVESPVDGPTVLITAGLHGNEPAGSRAAEQIRHWPIRRGRLIVVPRVNAPGLIELHYANGPVLSPAGREDLPEYLPLAVFRSEIAKYEPQRGTMIDTPAIAASPFGRGRAIVISPHPEAVAGLEPLVQRAVDWAGRKRDAAATGAERD